MKATNHNGRSGKHGAYNPKHNDRQFDVAKSDQIDAVRMLENVNWDYQRGIRLFKQENDDGISFETVELDYYEENFGEYIRNQNARNEQNRHPERNRTIEDMYKDTKTCPEETLWQIGNREESVDAEILQKIVQEFLEERDKQFGSRVVTLDWALHNDESTPHIHERHVFQCRNKYGEMCPQQEKALEELGIPLPNPDKPKGRNNNRKMTFDSTCRKMFISICKKYGIEVDEIPIYGGEKYLEKNDFIIKKQREELAEQNQQLARNGNLIIRGKRKIDEVAERAKSAEAELKVKDVEVQQKREELQAASVELAEKKTELADAKDELSDVKRKLKQAETKLAGANSEIAEAEKELQDTYADIDNADEVLAIKKQDIQEQDKKLKLVRSKVEEADELVNNICEIAYQIAFKDISGKAAELVRNESRKRLNAYNELMEETPMTSASRSFFESVMKRIMEIIEKPTKNFSEALYERMQWSRSVHMDDIQDRVWNHIETKAKEQERMGEEESLVVKLARNKRRGEVIVMGEYMCKNTKLPQYLPMPKFLTELPLSNTERYIYTLLLHRAQYSQMNGMVDEYGRVYIFYPIHQLAERSGKGETTIKIAIRHLIEVGILEKVSEGKGRVNRLYLIFPDEKVGKKTGVGKLTGVGRKTVSNYGENLTTSKYKSKNNSNPLRNYAYDEEESF